MKDQIKALIGSGLDALRAGGNFDVPLDVDIHIERGRSAEHGDFASNVAMVLAKPLKRSPREIAEAIVANTPASSLVTRLEVAGPGFINVHIDPGAYHSLVQTVRDMGEGYGRSNAANGEKVTVEFVSANPTGPLHVGHGRGAAYGDALSRVMRAAGYDVHAEYYVNDAGRQMHILAASVWLRYAENAGDSVQFPDNGYQGDYIRDIASDLATAEGDALRTDTDALFKDLPEEAETRIDTLIERLRTSIGDDAYARVFSHVRNALVEDIRQDLGEFRVNYDEWFSEQSLVDDGSIVKAAEDLKKAGHIYEKEGALWFKSTEWGDEKDRVVMRSNGVYTYFASDIAYLLNKARRGFRRLIYVWGADHHGYIARTNAAFEAFGKPADEFVVLLVQFANLYRGKERVSMSTRGGDFVTLRELREEVGNDAARFFYAMRRSEQHMDFDLELAKKRSEENPVYYVQYAHARICNVFRQAEDRGIKFPRPDEADHSLLVETHEVTLLNRLSRYPEVVENAARACEPHQIAYFVRELANDFHSYYNAHRFIDAQDNVRAARLSLAAATGQVLKNGLDLLGVSAPEAM